MTYRSNLDVDSRLMARKDYMATVVENSLDGAPVFLESDTDRKLFYKIAKSLGYTARVKKSLSGGWWAKSARAANENENDFSRNLQLRSKF
jgi:hypothetical protein